MTASKGVSDVTVRGVLQQRTSAMAVISVVIFEVGEELRSKWSSGKEGRGRSDGASRRGFRNTSTMTVHTTMCSSGDGLGCRMFGFGGYIKLFLNTGDGSGNQDCGPIQARN